MSGTPRVSVLLPVRDAETTLGTALRSVARQSERDFECIVVDDRSRDASRQIAAALASNDPRFRVLDATEAGLVPALERGLDACRAPLIARMDADDWMHRERLRLQCAAFDDDPTLSGVGSHVRLFPRARIEGGMRRYESWLNAIDGPESVAREAFVECPLAHPTWMLRSDVLKGLGYRDAGWPEDYDLILRALQDGHRLGVVPRRLLGWRQRPESHSRTGAAYHAERFLACKAHFLATGFLARDAQYVLWGYGDTGRTLRTALLEHGREPSHIVEVHQGRIGQNIHGAPVIAPAGLLALRPSKILVSVAGAGPRAQIRGELVAMGFRELRDFVCAA